jgi:hypothetical protein
MLWRTPEVIIPHQEPRCRNPITHGLHPLPDESRSRIASAGSVRPEPPCRRHLPSHRAGHTSR